MAERQSGFRWFLVAGCVLWIGCSEESATRAPGSGASGGNGVDVTAPITNGPTHSDRPIVEAPTPAPKEPSAQERVEAGRSAYNANCIACHSLDPTKDGALGPAVAGASLALLEARVMRSEYPEGYEPKRPTRVMIALPHLEPRLVELAAYLESLD